MKKFFLSFIALFLLGLLTIGVTYAYFTGEIENKKAIEVETHQLEIIYYGDEKIEGELQLVTKKEEGERRELSIALATENSLQAAANFYIYADKIDEGFSTPAFKWDFYEIIDGKEEHIESGTLEGLKSKQKIYFKTGIPLSTTTKKFAVYLWVNGHEAGNEVIGAELKGYIGAETETVSGNLE